MKYEYATSSAWDVSEIEGWIEEARAGSPVALGQLLDATRQYLVDLAQRRVSSSLQGKISPSDLVQETSLDVLRDFDDFRGQCLEELLGWLRQILLFNASQAQRRYHQTAKRCASREISLTENNPVADNLRDAIPSPCSQLVSAEEHQAVERAIARLSADHRAVILLRSRDHLSFIAIGDLLDRSPDAARKLWFRAIEHLQHELSHDGG